MSTEKVELIAASVFVVILIAVLGRIVWAASSEEPVEIRSAGSLVTTLPHGFRVVDSDFEVTTSNATVTIRYQRGDEK